MLLVSAVIGLVACLAWSPHAAAGSPTFTLYGDNNNGWGLTRTSISSPGPPLAVTVGDNVTLVLTSADGNTYRWFVDYNNDSARNNNEPRSPSFGTNVTWNFTADRVGTFRYRAQSDPSVMWGMFTVSNVTTPPGTPIANLNTLILVGGLVVAFVAIVAVAAIAARRKQEKQEEKKA